MMHIGFVILFFDIKKATSKSVRQVEITIIRLDVLMEYKNFTIESVK